MKKPDVLFIGGLKLASNGLVGGQLMAARALLNSELQNYVNWHIIDSTTNARRETPVPAEGRRSQVAPG